jgi:glycosyltransferase involved in cell wall biosynthesis
VRVLGWLAERGHDVHALLVGDGMLRDQLREQAAALGVADRLVFAGFRDQPWIARVISKASVIVSPHMGRALVEAALSAVPMVAYDYDWQRELVVSGETGFLVPNGDWEAMAERTASLLDDPRHAVALGQRARQRTATMMDPARLAQHERDTYTALLDRWRARRTGDARARRGESLPAVDF